MTNTWKITFKTGPNQWETITVMAQTHHRATEIARRFVGNHPVTNIV